MSIEVFENFIPELDNFINNESIDIRNFLDEEDRIYNEFLNMSQRNFSNIRECENNNNGLQLKLFKKIKKMKIGKSSKDCSICFSNFIKGEEIRKLPCGHIFHNGCIKTWLKISVNCPYCRLNLQDSLKN